MKEDINLKEAIEEAKQNVHITLTKKLYNKAKEGDLKAIFFFLERRYPEYWARKENLKINAKNENETILSISNDTLNKIIDLIKNESNK